jgi:hypothetical protein
MNDGLLDLWMLHGTPGKRDTISLIKATASDAGTHLYRDDCCNFFKGNSVTFTNRQINEKTGEFFDEMLFQVDGEGMRFKRTAKVEVEPEAIELIVNYDEIMRQSAAIE